MFASLRCSQGARLEMSVEIENQNNPARSGFRRKDTSNGNADVWSTSAPSPWSRHERPGRDSYKSSSAPAVWSKYAPSIGYLTLAGSKGSQADVAAQLAKVSACNFQGLGTDVYKKLDATCCDPATWTAAGVPAAQVSYAQWPKMPANSKGAYSCIPGDIGFGFWVRGWQGCNGSNVAWAEGCGPVLANGTVLTIMTEAQAANAWEKHQTYEGCHCHGPQITGDSCFVGATFEGIAYFGKSKGDAFCAAWAKRGVSM